MPRKYIVKNSGWHVLRDACLTNQLLPVLLIVTIATIVAGINSRIPPSLVAASSPQLVLEFAGVIVEENGGGAGVRLGKEG